MKSPFRFRNHVVSISLAVLALALVVVAATRFELIFPREEETWHPASPENITGDWQVILAQDDAPVLENGLMVTVTVRAFHDLNLDGLRGDPELNDGQVRLYNVEDYSDTRIFTENPLTGEEVRLCYGLSCKSPDANGEMHFALPRVIFESIPGIQLRMEHRPGRFPYFAFNDPYTVLGRLENQTIILTPRYSGSGEIFLPTAGIYDTFEVGFSPYPCVLPFDESLTTELLPMNFYDFDPTPGTVVNFDGTEPRLLREIDPSLGNYHSDNHTGLDFYYPRQEMVIRYACVVPPEFSANASSDPSGNLVFVVRTPLEGNFLIGYGHVAGPSTEEMELRQGEGALPHFGDAFAVIGDVGTSINHLHLSFGDFTDPSRTAGSTYCTTPPFPYLAGDPPYTDKQIGISQLGESVCFAYDHASYLAHQVSEGRIYAPFIPSIPLAALNTPQP
ncbi:MAG: hypothetical protein HPY85_08545 [Anaerolineae bacterium]|nr:hypothetical protein [Anaerolineae bacterium]